MNVEPLPIDTITARFKLVHPVKVVYEDGSFRRFTNLPAAAESAAFTEGSVLFEGERLSRSTCYRIINGVSNLELPRRDAEAYRIATERLRADRLRGTVLAA